MKKQITDSISENLTDSDLESIIIIYFEKKREIVKDDVASRQNQLNEKICKS